MNGWDVSMANVLQKNEVDPCVGLEQRIIDWIDDGLSLEARREEESSIGSTWIRVRKNKRIPACVADAGMYCR